MHPLDILIILTKTFTLSSILLRIFLPIVMRFIVSQLIDEVAAPSNITINSVILHINNTNLDDETTFAFLYGAIPTAPSVLIYASRYGLCENIVNTLLLQKKKPFVKFFIESKICSNLGIISKFYIKF